MKTCYHVILYRPRGTKTWTPVHCDAFDEKGNFFSAYTTALGLCHFIAGQGGVRYLFGLKKWTNIEFKVGRVVIFDDEPDAASEEPSPNLKPPKHQPPPHSIP
jgi:hypothetical protein